MAKRNLGSLDMAARIMMGIGMLAAGWYVAFELDSGYGLLIAAMGVFLWMTALARWCPVYYIIGLNSCPLHQRDEAVF